MGLEGGEGSGREGRVVVRVVEVSGVRGWEVEEEEEVGWGLQPSDVVGGVSSCLSSGRSGSWGQFPENPLLHLRRTWGWDWMGQG